MRRALCLAGSLLLTIPAPAYQPATPVELAAGIRQVEDGDLDAAILTLDGVVRRLAGVSGRRSELALAHLYLGMSYLGLDQSERAAEQFKEAWRQDKEMKLDPKKFPLRVINAYDEAKAEASRSEGQGPPATTKGGGKSKALLIVGGLAAVGGGLAAAGGSSPASPSATPGAGPQVLVSGGSSVAAPNVTTRFSSFTAPAAGVIQYTGNWTLAGSSFSLALGQNCAGFAPYAAETPVSSTRPLTLSLTVSAGAVYCPYAFYASGAGGESFSYQIVFTRQ
jgi:hypothetical protein